MEFLLGLGVALVIILLLYLWKNRYTAKDAFNLKVQNAQLVDESKILQGVVLELQESLGQEREKNRALLSQKKSSETRLGQISEHLVPFLENCPYDPKNLHFLGNPIDYVCFDFDEGSITFLEVKSGNSKPSKRQKTVKNIIKTGRIYYDEIRINEKGVKYRHVPVEGVDNEQSKKEFKQSEVLSQEQKENSSKNEDER